MRRDSAGDAAEQQVGYPVKPSLPH